MRSQTRVSSCRALKSQCLVALIVFRSVACVMCCILCAYVSGVLSRGVLYILYIRREVGGNNIN